MKIWTFIVTSAVLCCNIGLGAAIAKCEPCLEVPCCTEPCAELVFQYEFRAPQACLSDPAEPFRHTGKTDCNFAEQGNSQEMRLPSPAGFDLPEPLIPEPVTLSYYYRVLPKPFFGIRPGLHLLLSALRTVVIQS